jgi:predicted acetyltransferase
MAKAAGAVGMSVRAAFRRRAAAEQRLAAALAKEQF